MFHSTYRSKNAFSRANKSQQTSHNQVNCNEDIITVNEHPELLLPELKETEKQHEQHPQSGDGYVYQKCDRNDNEYVRDSTIQLIADPGPQLDTGAERKKQQYMSTKEYKFKML